jgi:hypothetical protein
VNLPPSLPKDKTSSLGASEGSNGMPHVRICDDRPHQSPVKQHQPYSSEGAKRLSTTPQTPSSGLDHVAARKRLVHLANDPQVVHQHRELADLCEGATDHNLTRQNPSCRFGEVGISASLFWNSRGAITQMGDAAARRRRYPYSQMHPNRLITR